MAGHGHGPTVQFESLPHPQRRLLAASGLTRWGGLAPQGYQLQRHPGDAAEYQPSRRETLFQGQCARGPWRERFRVEVRAVDAAGQAHAHPLGPVPRPEVPGGRARLAEHRLACGPRRRQPEAFPGWPQGVPDAEVEDRPDREKGVLDPPRVRVRALAPPQQQRAPTRRLQREPWSRGRRPQDGRDREDPRTADTHASRGPPAPPSAGRARL
mmetsp:Transcript_18941/g.52484  ORF Transcript_18941/g.52484 Transcript_18941/m.52484 type:complete len:212 (+) Transcript_18941:168-803(+)